MEGVPLIKDETLAMILVYSTKEASNQSINLMLGYNKTLEETGIVDGMQLTATECITQTGLAVIASQTQLILADPSLASD
jgi:hypothetical protein